MTLNIPFCPQVLGQSKYCRVYSQSTVILWTENRLQLVSSVVAVDSAILGSKHLQNGSSKQTSGVRECFHHAIVIRLRHQQSENETQLD